MLTKNVKAVIKVDGPSVKISTDGGETFIAVPSQINEKHGRGFLLVTVPIPVELTPEEEGGPVFYGWVPSPGFEERPTIERRAYYHFFGKPGGRFADAKPKQAVDAH